jgi:ABC-2 type transport system ATP-binding protein
MRADLAASLVHAPSILFLDEPTIGLDVVAKLAVRAFVKRLNRERGVTVILTTHDMDDIEALCERVIVIGDGAILSDGTLADLRKRVTRERWLTIDVADGSAASVADPEASVIRRDGERVCLAFDPEVISPAQLIQRVTSRHAVRDDRARCRHWRGRPVSSRGSCSARSARPPPFRRIPAARRAGAPGR